MRSCICLNNYPTAQAPFESLLQGEKPMKGNKQIVKNVSLMYRAFLHKKSIIKQLISDLILKKICTAWPLDHLLNLSTYFACQSSRPYNYGMGHFNIFVTGVVSYLKA